MKFEGIFYIICLQRCLIILQIQMKVAKFSENLNRCYRQYIQFFNEQEFSSSTITFLFIFQSLTVTSSTLAKISDQEPFQSLSLLGGHRVLTIISSVSTDLEIAVNSVLMILLLVPFSIPVGLIYQSYIKKYIKNGQYKKKCEFSTLNHLIRAYLITFEHLFFPVSLFYFLNLSKPIYVIMVLTLSIFIVVFVDYHILEIVYKEKNRIIKLLFPYKLIDTGLFVGMIYAARNDGDEGVSVAAAFAGNLIRFLLSLVLKFYTPSIMKMHQFHLIVNQILLLGFLIAYQSSIFEFILFNSLSLAFVAFLIRQKLIDFIETCKSSQKSSLAEEEQEHFQEALKSKSLQSLQFLFEKQGNFAGIFRRLIIMGKKTIQNRQFLTIQVLKSKCYGIEIGSRGTAAKIMDCETVMNYENLLKEIVCLVLQISNRSISMLKLMKMREEYIYIFNEEVQILIRYVNKIKHLIRELMKINEWSLEGQAILTIIFANIMRDDDFLEEIKQLRKVNKKQADKSMKIHLFNEKTVMVFVNMLDEMGKIVKTSKNLPAILGYNPNELEGIQIDSLLLSSLRCYHIQHMTNFIDNYDKRRALNPRNVLFYVNNHNYELQKIDVGYNFVMSSFNIFHMCGIIKKLDFDEEVIILNKLGNIEGFTKKIGVELGLNTIAGPQMNKYNLLCLMPSLMKYGDESKRMKTIIFKVKNMDMNVWKLEQSVKQAITKNEISDHVYNLFQKLLEDQIVDLYFVDIETSNYSFFHEQVSLKVIIVKNYQKIMNFVPIKEKIELALKKKSDLQQDTELRTFAETQPNLPVNEEQKLELDTNFSVDKQRLHMIKFKQIDLDECQVIDQKSFEVMDLIKSDESNGPIQRFQKDSNMINHNHKVRITRNWKCVEVLVILILCFAGLIIFDYVVLSSKVDQLQFLNGQIIRNNKALSLTLKALYDVDTDEIADFSDNKLMNLFSNLVNYRFNFTTFYNSSITYNDYYLFNVHIPTLLENMISSNETVVQQQTTELNLNILNIVTESDFIFKQILKAWNLNVDKVLTIYQIVLVSIILSVTLFLIIGICMINYRRKELITYQAFFRFEKDDMEYKIGSIKRSVKQLQSHVMKWYLSRQFHNYVKEGDIFNLQFESIKTIYEPKVGFEVSTEKEQNIKNSELRRYVIYLVVFVGVSILLCLLYTTQNSDFLNHLRSIPQEIDACSKVIVSPSLLLASINRVLPAAITQDYINSTEVCISKTINSLPSLLDFSSTAPCPNCTILYPYLTTNYLSFFNSFEEMVLIMKGGRNSSHNFQEMAEAAHVFSANLENQLYDWLNIYPSIAVPIIFILSLLIILVFTFIHIVKINEEIKCIEVFLQFFNKEMIEKNMRMVNLLEKKE